MAMSSVQDQEIGEETNDEIILTENSDIRQYEASKKLSTYKRAVTMITNAIKEQEKDKYKVVEARSTLLSTLVVTRLQEHESCDGLQHLTPILPDDSMLYNQAIKPIEQIENRLSSRMLAITTGAEATSTESLSDDPWERKIQIDKECDAFLKFVEAQIAEAKKMTSGTKKEITVVALMQKVAENSQGDFQPEVMAMLNEELTPKYSSALSEESYKRMY